MTDQMTSILDGLAWASLTEEARVAWIANKIVSKLARERDDITQISVKEAIRETTPPHGRGAAIFRKLWGDDSTGEQGEIFRQKKIHFARREARQELERHRANQTKLSTRLNNAYAFVFNRPPYCPVKENPISFGDFEGRAAWHEQERARDKGDVCIAMTHQNNHTICLLYQTVLVRNKKGDITRTLLGTQTVSTLAEAAIHLAGPKARAAIAKGKRVYTDWVGRKTFIHHDGSDHFGDKIEELPWINAVDGR